MQVFTQPWADAFRDRINESPEYRLHGADWHAPIGLQMSFRSNAEPRSVVLDLNGGACHAAHCAGARQWAEADLVISSSVDGWRKLLAGKLDPVWAIMSGKLKLVRGNLAELVPHAYAAKALVGAAAAVDATFPPPEGP